jgi:hypothetical protein
MNLNTNTNLQLFSELAGNSGLFNCLNFVIKDHRIDLNQSDITKDYLLCSSTESTFRDRIKKKLSGFVELNVNHLHIEDLEAIGTGEIDFHNAAFLRFI